MNREYDVDALARDWLHEGPTQISQRVVDEALVEVHRTHQRRAGTLRRFLAVNMTAARLAATAGVLALLVSVGVTLPYLASGPGSVTAPTCPSPIPTAAAGQSPAASPPPLDATFTSPLHGYSVDYPVCWTVSPATVPWTTTAGSNWGSPMLDELRGPTARFVAESQPLQAGQTREAWMAAYLGGGFDATAIDALPTVAVGDQVGVIHPGQWGAPASSGAVVPGALLYDAIVVVDERGYDITLDGNITDPYVRSVLATVRFDTSSAVDVLPSPSP